MRNRRTILCLLTVAAAGLMRPASAMTNEVCRPSGATDATEVIRSTARTLGILRLGDRVLHFRSAEDVQETYQSERPYPPFFSLIRMSEVWYDGTSGIERTEAESVFPGHGPFNPPTVVQDVRGAFIARDSGLTPAPRGTSQKLLLLNPLAMLGTWMASDAVDVAEECLYRDYWRTVLEKAARTGPERLYVDVKSGFPVKLEMTEPHYLWGQIHVEYLYSLWGEFDGVYYPRASFRMDDGTITVSRTVGDVEMIAKAEAPAMDLPADRASGAAELPMFLQAQPVDTLEVAEDTYLLQNPGYTHAVAFIDGTIYLLDATQSEDRARLDHELIRKLFPGDHPVVLIVTDLAWPHIAGMRYWVAQGATVLSHRISEDFLRRVAERRWTLNPDLLEQRRGDATLKFVGVDQARGLEGGKLRLAPIDGIGSEGALIVYLPESRFLWAGDFIQTLKQPTPYATDVVTAVRRAGFDPAKTAAQHLPLSNWGDVEAAQRSDAAP